jgi:hypothetical protein
MCLCVRKHNPAPLYVEEIANEALLSGSHFCGASKEGFGTTPRKHIVGFRLELA